MSIRPRSNMAGATGDVFGYQIQVDRELGSGSFGTVFEAIQSESGEIVAVKKISRNDSDNFSRTAGKEAANFQRLPKNHDNVVKVLDIKYQRPSLFIFMEKCNGGDLRNYFSCNYSTIDVKVKLKIMSQISDGLAYLHTLRIVHRDMKPANILVNVTSGQPVAKITDFGLSKFLGPDDTSLMTSDVGTAAYMAPEFWMKGDNGKVSYRSSVDIFATGLVYLAMLQATEGTSLCPSAEEPTGGSAEGAKCIGLAMYMRSTLHQPTLAVVSPKPGDSDSIKKLKKLIRNMTAFNPDERPKAADVDRLLKAIVTLMGLDE